MRKFALAITLSAVVIGPVGAQGQDDPAPVEVRVTSGGVQGTTTIAVPAMPAAQGASDALGRQIAEVISSAYRPSGS